jgi:hypothetical protein
VRALRSRESVSGGQGPAIVSPGGIMPLRIYDAYENLNSSHFNVVIRS